MSIFHAETQPLDTMQCMFGCVLVTTLPKDGEVPRWKKILVNRSYQPMFLGSCTQLWGSWSSWLSVSLRSTEFLRTRQNVGSKNHTKRWSQHSRSWYPVCKHLFWISKFQSYRYSWEPRFYINPWRKSSWPTLKFSRTPPCLILESPTVRSSC